MTVGEAVRLIRTTAGQTQREMAAVLDISNVHLSRVEGGKAHPSPALLESVRHHYDYCPLALVVLSDGKLNLTRHAVLLGKDYAFGEGGNG